MMIARNPVASLLLLLCMACGPKAVDDVPQRTVVAGDRDSTVAQVPLSGPQEMHTADGGRMLGNMVNGQRDGQWTAYFKSGIIRSRADYSEGRRNGPIEVFHENGMPYYTGQYKEEVKVGTWLFFDPQGKELKRVTYDSLGVLIE